MPMASAPPCVARCSSSAKEKGAWCESTSATSGLTDAATEAMRAALSMLGESPPATSVPSPTFTPASSSPRAPHTPLQSVKLLLAQCATPVPVSRSSRTSLSSRYMQCAITVLSPSSPARSYTSAYVSHSGWSSRTHAISPRFSPRWDCTGSPSRCARRPSSLISSIVHVGTNLGVTVGVTSPPPSETHASTNATVSRTESAVVST
mmetsp:Transcript_3946/g.13814  ORF Transcript_3946/g.13814 Transcript_3946/m.13814 type:complete len:206 (-) Transcript_3946:580-1197(-)